MKKKNNMNKKSEIPTTGRLGQWVKAMKNEGIDQSVIKTVMHDADHCMSTSNHAGKAEWIENATECLEKSVGKKTCLQIMENKGRTDAISNHQGRNRKEFLILLENRLAECEKDSQKKRMTKIIK